MSRFTLRAPRNLNIPLLPLAPTFAKFSFRVSVSLDFTVPPCATNYFIIIHDTRHIIPILTFAFLFAFLHSGLVFLCSTGVLNCSLTARGVAYTPLVFRLSVRFRFRFVNRCGSIQYLAHSFFWSVAMEFNEEVLEVSCYRLSVSVKDPCSESRPVLRVKSHSRHCGATRAISIIFFRIKARQGSNVWNETPDPPHLRIWVL